MPTPTSPLGQLALGASLRGKLSQQFAGRPTLLSVAQAMILDQWRARRIADHLEPWALTLMRRLPSGRGYRFSSLDQVLVERYCQGSTINLSTGQDFLTLEPGAEHPRAEAIDLHALELLINECAPFLIDQFKQQLTQFWVADPAQGTGRWQWLADHLRDQLRTALDLEREAGNLDTREIATAALVALHPDRLDRMQGNLAETQVFLLNLDVLADQHLDPELASALVIERHLPEPQRDVLLVFTLAGGVHRFESCQALAEALARNWSQAQPDPAFALNLHEPSGSAFEAQARLLLAQQLRLIEAVAVTAVSANAPIYLLVAIDEATSMLDICTQAERQKLMGLHAALPRWLREASAADSRGYADGLLKLAIAQQRVNGASFLDGIVPILDHASQVLQATLQADHPQWVPFDIAEIRIVNRKVTAAVLTTGGTFAPQGEIEDVVFTLPQLAIENLTAVHAGSVTLSRTSGQPLPAWLTFDYVKSLITRLDIGQAYPDLLRLRLLDDPAQSKAREALFAEQLHLQLPLQALQLNLQGQAGITSVGAGLVTALLRPPEHRLFDGRVVVLRPLAFIRKPGAVADVALNAFLVEPQDLTTGPCILYRPLHRQSLLEFTSRQALLEEISEAGALQNDVLGRLDEPVRAVYARGGFLQPHIVRFTQGMDFSPLEIPAPARLGDTAVVGQLAHAIYLASARELIERAKAQSVSNSESRWIAYAELGWLMLNCWLPLLNGVAATAGWMVQIFEALQSELQQDQEGRPGKVSNLIGLLFNLALIIFVSSTQASTLKAMPVRTGQRPVDPARVTAQVLEAPVTSPVGQPMDALDFSWANPMRQLTAAQRSLLARYKVATPVAALGQAVPHGDWQGLYLHEQQWWAVIDGAVYRVMLEDSQARIVDIGRAQEPGPWIVRGASGNWQLDLALKLRGGMPLRRRIEALRLSNQQRTQELETALAAYAPERNRMGEKILRDLIQISARIDSVTPEQLQACAEELKTHYAGLTRAHEQYQALNQLKALADFKKHHVQYLAERASTQSQLLQVSRFRYLQSKKRVHAISAPEGVDRLRELVRDPDSAEYRELLEWVEQGRQHVEEAVASYELILTLKQELRRTSLGLDVIADLDEDMSNEPSLKSWQAIQIHQLGALLIDKVQDRSAGLLRSIIEPAGLGLRMQAELESDTVFSDQERIQILDSCVRNYAVAQETLENYRPFVIGQEGQRLFERLSKVVNAEHDSAQAELADRLRALPQQATEAAPPTGRAQRLIRTRNRGVVLGRTRQSAAGESSDAVVVTDPIDGSELASFKKKPDEQVWDQVQEAPRARVAARDETSLATLLSRAETLLNEADRQMQRAQSQARTANIPIEMEEILARQAEPLDELVQQIEQALTRTNDTDRVLGQGDAALKALALNEKAEGMRREGRRLRIEIIKARPPTASRVAYLKQQGEVRIARVGERKATARKKGRPQDYLQEYVIQDTSGNPLWYAHFHYAALDAPAGHYTAAHLKTVEQRFDGGQANITQVRDNQAVIQVYRSQIDKVLARELFIGEVP